MKTLILSLAILCSSLLANSQPTSATTVEYALNLEDFDVCENQKCYLTEGRSAYFYRTFLAGVTYEIVAFSEDEDVQDVDLFLYESYSDEPHSKDVTYGDVAVVMFTPLVTREMKVVFENHASADDYNSSLCKVMIGSR